MSTPALAKIDLNLLVVLDVLLREKSVKRTANQLNLTSSAVSHALKRLRLLFDNELLVRDGKHMVPTVRGRSLAETLPSLLAQVENTLSSPEPFKAATSTRSFRLAAPDFISPLLPHLLETIASEAPGVSVQVAAYSPTAALDMRQGRYDALIAPSIKPMEDMMRGMELGTWPWMTFGRTGHPAFSNWCLETWTSFPHVQVSATSPSGRNPIDRALAKLGTTREIGAVVPQFSMAAPILTCTDMLLSVPSVAMQDTARVYGLSQIDLPFDVLPLKLSLFHNVANGDEPEVRWFRALVAKSAEALTCSQ